MQERIKKRNQGLLCPIVRIVTTEFNNNELLVRIGKHFVGLFLRIPFFTSFSVPALSKMIKHSQTGVFQLQQANIFLKFLWLKYFKAARKKEQTISLNSWCRVLFLLP